MRLGVRCASLAVALEAPAPKDGKLPAAWWVQLGYEGTWAGYVPGKKVQLSRADLENMVTRFRASKNYRPGATTAPDADILAGKFDLIQADWRHVSERDAGEVPMELQLPKGWALELEVRTGRDEAQRERAELWGYARFLDDVPELIRTDKIKWTSVAADSRLVDKATGAPLGWVLTSWALTNKPFLEGMVTLKEAARFIAEAGGRLPTTAFEWYGPARSPHESVQSLRDLFGLSTGCEKCSATGDCPMCKGVGGSCPTCNGSAKCATCTGTGGNPATLADVLGAVHRVRGWLKGAGEPPAGMDVEDLIRHMRTIFNLRGGASPAEIFDEADRLVADLAESGPPSSHPSPIGMSMPILLTPSLRKFLLERLAIRDEHLVDEATLVLALEASLAPIIARSASFEQLVGVLYGKPANEVPPAQAAPAQVLAFAADVRSKATAHDAAAPRFALVQRRLFEAEIASATRDVDRVCLERGIDAKHADRFAFEMARSGGVEPPAKGADASADEIGAFLDARSRSAIAFEKRFPPTTLTVEQAALTFDFVGNAAARAARETAIAGQHDAYLDHILGGRTPPPAGGGGGGGGAASFEALGGPKPGSREAVIAEIELEEGANAHARCMSYIKKKRPDLAKRDRFNDLTTAATELFRSLTTPAA